MLYEIDNTLYIDDRYPADVFAEERRAARERRAELAAMYDELAKQVKFAEQAAMDELAAFGNIEYETGVSDSEWSELDDERNEYAFECACWDFYAPSFKGYDLYELY